METNYSVTPVIGPPKELSKLGLSHSLSDFGDLCRCLVEGLFALFVLSDVEEETRFFEIRSVLFPGIYDAFEGGLFSENGLSFFSVVPEVGLRCDFVEFFYALLLAVDVKDASAEARVALLGG